MSQLPHLQRNDDRKIRLDNSSVSVSLSVCLAVLGHLTSSSPRGIKTGPVEPEPQGWAGEHLLVAGGDVGGAAPTWQGLGRLSQAGGELCEYRAVKTTVTGHLPKLRRLQPLRHRAERQSVCASPSCLTVCLTHVQPMRQLLAPRHVCGGHCRGSVCVRAW